VTMLKTCRMQGDKLGYFELGFEAFYKFCFRSLERSRAPQYFLPPARFRANF
jgi:hypothetical protein